MTTTGEEQRIENVLQKISDLLSIQAVDAAKIEELAGTLEAIRENAEVIRGAVGRSDQIDGDGEKIKDVIEI